MEQNSRSPPLMCTLNNYFCTLKILIFCPNLSWVFSLHPRHLPVLKYASEEDTSAGTRLTVWVWDAVRVGYLSGRWCRHGTSDSPSPCPRSSRRLPSPRTRSWSPASCQSPGTATHDPHSQLVHSRSILSGISIERF